MHSIVCVCIFYISLYLKFCVQVKRSLVNPVQGLTDCSMGFTAMKTSTMCIDLPKLIKYDVM